MSLVCAYPRYLHWLTSSWVVPFIHMLVDGLDLMLLTRFLLSRSWFPCLNQQPFSPVFQWVLAVLRCLPADQYRRQTASYRAVVLRWALATVGRDVSFFYIFYCITDKAVFLRWLLRCQSFLHYLFQEHIKLNSTRGNGHPYRTPTVFRDKYLILSFSDTAVVISSYGDQMTSISWLSMLYSFKTPQRPSCQTPSNAFLK